MTAHVRIEDVALWLKHIDEPDLQTRLARLAEGETIHLETDGVVGRWRRMRQGKGKAVPDALLPDGPMKTIWNEWYRVRKGSRIEIREVTLADEFLASGSLLFSEWYSEADEEAFRDL